MKKQSSESIQFILLILSEVRLQLRSSNPPKDGFAVANHLPTSRKSLSLMKGERGTNVFLLSNSYFLLRSRSSGSFPHLRDTLPLHAADRAECQCGCYPGGGLWNGEGAGERDVVSYNSPVAIVHVTNDECIGKIARCDGCSLRKCPGDGVASVIKRDEKLIADVQAGACGDDKIAASNTEGTDHVELIIAGAGSGGVKIDIKIGGRGQCDRTCVQDGCASDTARARRKVCARGCDVHTSVNRSAAAKSRAGIVYRDRAPSSG